MVLTILMSSTFFIKALKSELRASGVTYRELAKTLKLSEAGVKKLLNKTDLSMNRAQQICQTIGVSMSDVLRASEEAIGSEKKFTEQQLSFFRANPHYFNFYMQLVYEQKVPEEIRSETGLSEKSLFKYLKKLDDLNLIKLLPGNRISFPEGIVAKVNISGTFLEKIKNSLTVDLIKKAERTNRGAIFGGIFFLSRDESAGLEQELRELKDKYTRRSLSNRSLKKIKGNPNYSTTTTMTAVAPFSLFEDIKNID